jgi:hypothetical protein
MGRAGSSAGVAASTGAGGGAEGGAVCGGAVEGGGGSDGESEGGSVEDWADEGGAWARAAAQCTPETNSPAKTANPRRRLAIVEVEHAAP